MVRSSVTNTDLNLDFTAHPVTQDIGKLKNEDSIKTSLRNLIMINHFEKPFHPEIGSDIRYSLFENITSVTAINLTKYIETTIENFEPRVNLNEVIVQPDYDANGYTVTITFYLKNENPNLINVNMFLNQLK